MKRITKTGTTPIQGMPCIYKTRFDPKMYFFKVSEIVIARRALDTGKITQNEFLCFYEEYKNREYSKKEGLSGGGDYYATAKKRVSITFAAHVNQAVKSGQLLYRDAYRLTGMQGDTFQKFFDKNVQAMPVFVVDSNFFIQALKKSQNPGRLYRLECKLPQYNGNVQAAWRNFLNNKVSFFTLRKKKAA